MSILQKNSTSGFSKNIFGEEEPSVFFNEKIQSTNIPKYYFINFINSKKDPLVGALKEQRRRILKKEVNYDQEYEIKNVEYKKNEKNKIIKILENTIGYSNINYSLLFRLKYKANPEIQFFFLDDLKGKYEVLFVDIYHLVLPAADKSHKEKMANPKQKYINHKDAKYNLNNIFHK